jgi:signal transduction histidine kinase
MPEPAPAQTPPPVDASAQRELELRGKERQQGLRWLVQLRWWALIGTLLGLAFAWWRGWDFVNANAIIGGVGFMALVNIELFVRARRLRDVGKNELLVHATVDMLLLSWLLAWSGGLTNPISIAFSFHVVLGALLNGRRGVLWSSGMSLALIAGLWFIEDRGLLPTRPLGHPPALLLVPALSLLVVGVGYLAMEVAQRQAIARKRLMEQLVVDKRHVMLERLATLGRALQGVAHELNTPLTTMQTLAKDLKAALADASLDDKLRADVDESLQILIEESQRCRSLTQALLSQARDGGARGSQTLLEVAQRAVRLVGADERDEIALDDVSLSVAPPHDADRILQVVMNLMQNSLIATKDKRGDGKGPRVRVHAERTDNVLKLVLVDRGPGLPLEVKEHLFEPFVTTRPMGEGTGLGLYTSQMIARELGASLTLEDAEPVGTRATLTLSVLPM